MHTVYGKDSRIIAQTEIGLVPNPLGTDDLGTPITGYKEIVNVKRKLSEAIIVNIENVE